MCRTLRLPLAGMQQNRLAQISWIALRWVMGCVFILSAVSKLFPIALFELNLVFAGVATYSSAPLLARAAIVLEFWLGTALLVNHRIHRWVLPTTGVLLTLFTTHLVITIAQHGNSGNCGCFGNWFSMTPLQSIIKNIGLGFIVLILWRKSPRYAWSLPWINLALLPAAVSAVWLAGPMGPHPQAQGKPAENGTTLFLSETLFSGASKPIDWNNGTYLAVFFNPNCSHCQELALALGVMQKETPLPKMLGFFLGEARQIPAFLEDAHINMPYKVYDFNSFFSRLKSGSPRICLVHNGAVAADFNYQTFSPRALQQALSRLNAERPKP